MIATRSRGDPRRSAQRPLGLPVASPADSEIIGAVQKNLERAAVNGLEVGQHRAE
jgi:hypothetical protein